MSAYTRTAPVITAATVVIYHKYRLSFEILHSKKRTSRPGRGVCARQASSKVEKHTVRCTCMFGWYMKTKRQGGVKDSKL